MTKIAPSSADLPVPWWSRPSLGFRGDDLYFCNRPVAELAAAFDEPVFLYDADRLGENVARLAAAMSQLGAGHRLYYAMKANRFMPLLCTLRASPLYGIDVCSPEELRFALQCGFAPERISYTAHGLEPDDARLLAALPGVHVNCDTLSAIRLLGGVSPGREIGLRINPGIGLGYGDSERLTYAGAVTTKFGIYAEQFEQALALAQQHQLRVTWLHCHAGCGYLNPQLDALERIVAAVRHFAAQVPTLQGINLGGGLGLPHRVDDPQLDLSLWAERISNVLAGLGVIIAIEPGDYIAKDAGMLVLRAVYAEHKRERKFVGLSGGFNLAVEPAFYGLPCEPVPCRRRAGPVETVTLAGNINEALDIWAQDVNLPPIEAGDFVALLNAGGYASSMSSQHCLRGRFRELLLYREPLGSA